MIMTKLSILYLSQRCRTTMSLLCNELSSSYSTIHQYFISIKVNIISSLTQTTFYSILTDTVLNSCIERKRIVTSIKNILNINLTFVPIQRQPNTFGVNRDSFNSNRSSIPCWAKQFGVILSQLKDVVSNFPLKALHCFTWRLRNIMVG